MTLSLSVKSNFKQLTRGLNKVQRSIIPAAANSALNKAGRKVKTIITRDLAKEMGLKQKDIKNKIKVKKSNFRTLSVFISATGRRLNIIRFKAKALKKALTAKPWGKARRWRTGFIGNKGRTAFLRLPNKKIKALSGPGIASEFVRRRVIKLMKTIGGDEFLKQFSRELKRRIAKL